MRFIAAIAVVAIIVVGFLIYQGIKAAQASRIKATKELQADRNHYRDLFKLTRRELQTIVDTDGEGAAFNAQLAIDEVDAQIERYNEQKELEKA